MKKQLLPLALALLVAPAGLVAQSTILLPIGSGPFATAYNPQSNSLLVANRNSNTLSIVNLADNSIKTTLSVGLTPTSVAFNPTTNKAVVTNFGSNTVSIIDLATEKVDATVEVGNSPRDVAIDTKNNVAIITNLNGNSVSLVDLNTNQNLVTSPIQVGRSPIAVAYNPELNQAMVANFLDGNLSIIDLTNRAAIGNIVVGIDPVDIAVNLETKRAVVANSGTNDVTVIDLTKNTAVATVALGVRPFAVGVNPRTNVAAVLSNSNRSISLVNLADNTKFTTAITQLGDNPVGITVNEERNQAFVSNITGDSILVSPLGFLNYLPFALDTQNFRSNLAVNNLGSSEANIEIELRDAGGNLVVTGSSKVAAQGLKQINSFIQELTGASGPTGTIAYAKVMSDQPMSSFISVIDNSTDDPALQSGRVSGFPKVLLNAVTNVGAFRSQLMIINLGNATAATKLTARDNVSGAILATKEDIFIPVGGFFYTENILADMGISGQFGPLQVESPNIQPLIVVTRVASDQRTGGFLEGVPIQ
ncbi:MAG: YncE family protein [Acidobacteriota bacterium]